MLHNADSHHLLAVVAAVHHQRVGETLNDGALGLAEALDVEAASAVRDVLVVLGLLLNGDVVLQGDVADYDVAESPVSSITMAVLAKQAALYARALKRDPGARTRTTC